MPSSHDLAAKGSSWKSHGKYDQRPRTCRGLARAHAAGQGSDPAFHSAFGPLFKHVVFTLLLCVGRGPDVGYPGYCHMYSCARSEGSSWPPGVQRHGCAVTSPDPRLVVVASSYPACPVTAKEYVRVQSQRARRNIPKGHATRNHALYAMPCRNEDA